MTSTATARSTGFPLHRFRTDQSFAHCRTFGKVSGAIHDGPPSYGMSGSAVPWNITIGTARRSVHQLHGSVCADATRPTAAIRSESAHESTNDIPPPLDRPFAKIMRRSMLYFASSVSINAAMNPMSRWSDAPRVTLHLDRIDRAIFLPLL